MPFMAGIYLLVALYVLVTHLTLVPGMLAHIVGNAFGFAARSAAASPAASRRRC